MESATDPDREPLERRFEGNCVCDACVDAVLVLVGLADGSTEDDGTADDDSIAEEVITTDDVGTDEDAGCEEGVTAEEDDSIEVEEDDSIEVAEDMGSRVARAGDEEVATGVAVAGAAFVTSVFMALVTAAISLALPAP